MGIFANYQQKIEITSSNSYNTAYSQCFTNRSCRVELLGRRVLCYCEIIEFGTMGNHFRCCQSSIANKDTHELNFFANEEPMLGRLSAESMQYLKPTDLSMFRLSAGANLQALQLLIKQGGSPLVTDTNRTSLLHCASRSGSCQVVEQLVQEGLDVNLADVDGWTPIHIAAELQRHDVVLCLLRLGANPYLKNRRNTTPYEMLSNTDLKSLATMKAIGEASEGWIDRDGLPQARKLYEQNMRKGDETSINQEIDVVVLQKTSQWVMQERKAAWQNFSTEIPTKYPESTNPVPVSTELLDVFISQKSEWALQYAAAAGLLHGNFSEFLFTNGDRHTLMNFLSSYHYSCMYELALSVLEKFMVKEQRLASCITRVFSECVLPRDTMQLSFLSGVFAAAWCRARDLPMRELELTERLVFTVFLASSSKQEVMPHSKERIKESASALCMPCQELLAFRQTKRKKRSYKFREACLKGRKGKLLELPGGFKVLLCQSPLIMKPAANGYDCWQLTDGMFMALPDPIIIKTYQQPTQ